MKLFIINLSTYLGYYIDRYLVMFFGSKIYNICYRKSEKFSILTVKCREKNDFISMPVHIFCLRSFFSLSLKFKMWLNFFKDCIEILLILLFVFWQFCDFRTVSCSGCYDSLHRNGPRCSHRQWFRRWSFSSFG